MPKNVEMLIMPSIVGGAAMLLGGFLVFQSIREVIGVRDIFMLLGVPSVTDFFVLLGAPIVTNGIMLFLYGVMLLVLVEMIRLLNHIANK